MTTPATFGSEREAIDSALAEMTVAAEHYAEVGDRSRNREEAGYASGMFEAVELIRFKLRHVSPPPATAQGCAQDIMGAVDLLHDIRANCLGRTHSYEMIAEMAGKALDCLRVKLTPPEHKP